VQRGFRALAVVGTLDFALTAIVASPAAAGHTFRR
jgi:hypothetical protein